MRRFYRPGSRIEAYLLRDLLRHAGIATYVFNENAQSAVGEIPADVVTPELWLVSDSPLAWEQATAVVRAYEAQRHVTGVVRCRGCGEENPANFELCWSCGKSIP